MAFTFFFRDVQILELAIKHLVPSVMGRSRVRIWDAGCAMGPEPYTLAIMLAEKMGHFAFKNLTICATDVDETNSFGEIVKNGVYHEDELKRLPEGILDRYFSPDSRKGYFKIADLIRERVTFKKHDLLSLQPMGTDFSLVLCKNVLLHFQPLERIEVIKAFYASLSQGGFFATEQTQKMPEPMRPFFEQIANDGQVFRKVEVGP